jgi:1,4-alpha-glucan branching enzyme
MPAIDVLRKLRDSVMKPKVNGQSVEFTYYAPHAKKAFLSGKFNSWNTTSHPMKKDKDGVWTIKVVLPSGRYEYKFFVDDAWCEDTSVSEVTPNPFRSHNYVIGVE